MLLAQGDQVLLRTPHHAKMSLGESTCSVGGRA
jgi:hypothetical protein